MTDEKQHVELDACGLIGDGDDTHDDDIDGIVLFADLGPNPSAEAIEKRKAEYAELWPS